MKFDKAKINKILVIKPAAIGDVLLCTPVLENLRAAFPKAQIVFLTQKYCKEALTGNPFVDRILTYDLALDSGWFLIRSIRKQKYDLVIDLFSNPRTAIITFMSGARYKVGYSFNWRALAYNIRVKPRSPEVHNIDFNLDALRRLGIDSPKSKPYFYISPIHKEFADDFVGRNFKAGRKIIGLNPCGTWPTKVWSVEKFAALADELGSEYDMLIFWGSGEEKKIAERLKESIKSFSVLIPEVDIKYMGALLKKCEAFVTNDTGPMHISWILGVNTAAIFGPTNSHLQGPRSENSVVIKNDNLDCLGCNLTKVEECPNSHRCMGELDVNYVVQKVRELINKKIQ